MIAKTIIAIALTQAQTVTFEHPCAHSSVVLEALGKELGRTLKPSGSVNKDYFLVRFDKIPVNEAMDKIAETLNATWSEERRVLYLGRTRKQENDEVVKEQNENIAAIEKWLASNFPNTEFTTELARSNIEAAITYYGKLGGNFDMNEYNSFRQLERNAPIGRYLLRLLREIGSRQIAATDEFVATVYSDQPNATERPLPKGEATRHYGREMGVVDRAVSVAQAETLRALAPESAMLPSEQEPRIEGGTTLRIRRDDDSITAQLRTVNGGWAYENIPLALAQSTAMPDELTTQPGAYQPTDIEAAFAKHLKDVFILRMTSLEGSDPKALDPLRDPARNEPLTVFGSNWILASIKALNKNAVVLLPDEMFLVSFLNFAQSRTGFRELWASVPTIGGQCNIKIEERWLTSVPQWPRKTRQARIDRRAWAALIARHVPDVAAPLEEKAGYLALTDNDMLASIAAISSIILFMDLSLVELRYSEREPLRIFGRLRQEQQAAAREEGFEVSLDSLPADLIRPAMKILFNESTIVEPGRMKIEWGSSFRPPTPAMLKPNDAFSAGYPRGSLMRVYVIGRDMLYQQREDGPPSQAWTEQDLGQHLARIEFQPEEASIELLPLFTIGRAEQVIVEFEFPGIGYVYSRSQVPLLSREPKYVALDELPEPVKSAVYKARDAARKMYEKIGGG